MTTEEYKEMYNITVTNFDIAYVTAQDPKSATCAAHALATMLNIYYGANLYNWNDFWNENNSQASFYDNWVKGDNYYSSESEYLSEIKQRLDYGMPVDIVVWNGGNTHFVTAIGYELDENGDFTFDGIVIADPGTSSDKKVTTIGNAYTTYTEYEYGSDGYRIIIPYLIDENNQFILDEDGNKTIDLKYAQVVENVDTGEGIESDEDFPVIEPLTVTENGRYEPEEGVDGFSPVDVNVDDRYDEGYSDGYNEAEELWKTLYDQAEGYGEDITLEVSDSEGNPVVAKNAIRTDDLNKIIKSIHPCSEITAYDIGGDCAITLKPTVEVNRSGSLVYGASLITTNLKTGDVNTQNLSCRGFGWIQSATPLNFVFDSVEITSLTCTVWGHFSNMHEDWTWTAKTYASWVGGTGFSGTQGWAVTTAADNADD